MMDSEIKLEDSERQECEIWTRVMGYHRPVSEFNKGKKAEHSTRKCFVESKLYNQKRENENDTDIKN